MPSSKRQVVVDSLREEITAGRLGRGVRLPGEHELADRFAVSRGTVRAALAELADADYISTRGGVGSVVTFDGAALDPRSGWARSIAASGAHVTTHVLRTALVTDEVAAAELGRPSVEFVAVDRYRRVVDGPVVSLERSLVPADGRLRDLPRDGLVDDSLTATLVAAGLVPARAEQWVDVVPVTGADADLLGVAGGALFLHSRRVSRTGDGRFVERVDSLLAPDRFRLHMTFGSPS